MRSEGLAPGARDDHHRAEALGIGTCLKGHREPIAGRGAGEPRVLLHQVGVVAEATGGQDHRLAGDVHGVAGGILCDDTCDRTVLHDEFLGRR